MKQIAKLLYLTAVLGVFAFWAYLCWYKPILLQRQALGATLTAGTARLEIAFIIYGETRWIYTLSSEQASIIRRQCLKARDYMDWRRNALLALQREGTCLIAQRSFPRERVIFIRMSGNMLTLSSHSWNPESLNF